MQDIISLTFINIIHNTTTSLCPPQTPPASKKRKRDEEDSDDDLITIEKPYYDKLIEMASLALFEGCYGRTTSETEEWLQNMNTKIADAAAAGKQSAPSPPPKKTQSSHPPLDKSILGNIGKLNRLEKTIASIQNDVKQMREDIFALEQERKGGGSFGYRDEDGYKRCRSEICCDTEMKMYTMHACYLDCVKEMMREYDWWWNENGWFTHHMDTFVQLALDGSITSDEWLNCYKEIVNNMERDKDECAKRKVAIPHKIHHLAKQLSLDAIFTIDEEREVGHTMVACDLTDCQYCDEKKKKTAAILF